MTRPTVRRARASARCRSIAALPRDAPSDRAPRLAPRGCASPVAPAPGPGRARRPPACNCRHRRARGQRRQARLDASGFWIAACSSTATACGRWPFSRSAAHSGWPRLDRLDWRGSVRPRRRPSAAHPCPRRLRRRVPSGACRLGWLRGRATQERERKPRRKRDGSRAAKTIAPLWNGSRPVIAAPSATHPVRQ